MAKAGSASSIPTERLDQYERLVRTVEGLTRKGAKVPYTSINGNMSSYLSETGDLALRLPSGDREAFIERYGTSLHQAYGIVQKEYVAVPTSLLANTDELAPWFRRSYDYVAGLKPKPTTRRKKA